MSELLFNLRSTDILRGCVRLLRNLVGAEAVSLYLPASPEDLNEPILLHEGDDDPVAELADPGAAAEFCSRFGVGDGQEDTEHHHQVFRRVSSSSTGGLLIRVSPPLSVLQPGTPGEPRPSRRAGDLTDGPPTLPGIWIGLRGADNGRLRLPASLRDLASSPELGQWWDWLISLGAALALHARQVSSVIDDPVSGLPGRGQFETRLTRTVEQGGKLNRSFTLILVNPDDFEVVNEHFGREAGDMVVREIANRLVSLVRSTDVVHRYGGAIFTILLPDSGLEDGVLVAEKIRSGLAEGAYLQGTVRLGFSLGLTAFTPEEFDDAQTVGMDLFRQADRALHVARESGGGRIVTWGPDADLEEVANIDRLSGIFTADLAKDYRNMLLLWDIVGIISANPDPEDLAAQAIDRLQAAFKPERMALFLNNSGEAEPEPVAIRNSLSIPEAERNTLALNRDQKRLVREAFDSDEPMERTCTGEQQDEPVVSWAVPLVSQGAHLGCLYMDGGQVAMTIETSDLLFLKAFAHQLAVALDHARLAALDRTRQEEQRSLLRAELNDLRRALGQARLVSRSPEMDSVLATVRRVAPTTATVLITGESGTGKELLARTIHEMSERKDKPFIVVDCGAIASTLIDSELFGREKGAYTGAQERARGRLAEADGGTVVLDEIGELPIEVQSKLLRFVQEKQITPVGGTRTREVDVRLIAVTNRDLASEVKAGQFREDLYHRLNVVAMESPALRHRPDDVLHLAEHFLNIFALQYQKGIHRFSSEAEAGMLDYDWPGNVRELQNRVMKAVILSDGSELGIETLGIGRAAGPDDTPAQPAYPFPAAAPETGPQDGSTESTWNALAAALGQQVRSAARNGRRGAVPLGRWLAEDMILEAYEASGRVYSRGAVTLGIPETTFRRKAARILGHSESGLLPRSADWSNIRPLIAAWLRSDLTDNENRLDMLRNELLARVAEQSGDQTSLAAALMGVTAATYRSWLEKLPQTLPVPCP